MTQYGLHIPSAPLTRCQRIRLGLNRILHPRRAHAMSLPADLLKPLPASAYDDGLLVPVHDNLYR
jgi:hypothetical protein